MVPFVLYALILWWQAAKRRRTVAGLLVVLIGAPLTLPAADPLVYLVWWVVGEQPVWLYPFLTAYAGALGAVGLFLWALPRRRAEVHCPVCFYDLAGNETGVCPECGHVQSEPIEFGVRRLRERQRVAEASPPERSLASRVSGDRARESSR